MTASANKHRRDVGFAVDDLVFLKFRPYRQTTLFKLRNRKLAPRYFGPFRVQARVGPSAYCLDLPAPTCIHPVFHVSLLKKAIGAAVAEPNLPEDLTEVNPPFLPKAILDRRSVPRDGDLIEQVLIQWDGLPADDATWLDVADIKGQFPFFSLADKANSTGEVIDTPWRVYTRGPRKIWADPSSSKVADENMEKDD